MQVGVKIVLDHPDAKIPVYAKPGDAGADVYAVVGKSTREYIDSLKQALLLDEKLIIKEPEVGDYILPPRKTVLVDLGLRIELPDGWEMQVRPRSGVAKRGLVVVNSPGTIDSGYRGPCMVLLHNNTDMFRIVKPGTRIAQFVLKEAPQARYEQTLALSSTDRGTGGFGSTGTK